MLSRRIFLQGAAATSLVTSTAFARPSPPAKLQSMTDGARAISVEERRGRIAKAQALMAQRKIAALLVEPGASLDYFTGVRWHRSERTTLAIIPASGEVLIVTPAFEET